MTPGGSLENLPQDEIDMLLDKGQGGLYSLPRRRALAVPNTGDYSDDALALFDRYKDFALEIIHESWGINLEIINAPGIAFVDRKMIRGMRELLFAVLRDIVYVANEFVGSGLRFLHQQPNRWGSNMGYHRSQ